MDQKKIGQFIAKCRKEKKMTQAHLAEILGVTDKSISNWENARCMPDLSMFKPLCDALGITINDLMSGERVDKELYQEKFEENIINTIDYSRKKINLKNRHIGLIVFVFGMLTTLSAISTFPSESSWCCLYSLLGVMISLVGLLVIFKKMSLKKKIIMGLGYCVVCVSILLGLDYIHVVYQHQVPRFSYSIETNEQMILYKSPFCHVYRINRNSENEYYIIDTKKQYTEKTVPISPFNRTKSGIDHLITYKNQYLGNNSNTGHLIDSLPLSQFGYVFEIDSKNLSLTIDYHMTDWYINEDYLKKSLLYNSISLFLLIDNVESIQFNFSGNTYQISKSQIQLYPHYQKLFKGKINKNDFNEYVEKKMNDDEFINSTFQLIFQNQ